MVHDNSPPHIGFHRNPDGRISSDDFNDEEGVLEYAAQTRRLITFLQKATERAFEHLPFLPNPISLYIHAAT
jgi:hypothetical protein